MRIAIIGLAALPAIGAAMVAVLSALGTGGRPALAEEARCLTSAARSAG